MAREHRTVREKDLSLTHLPDKKKRIMLSLFKNKMRKNKMKP